MTKYTVPEADAILDKEIKVLDYGSVALLDYMGSDRAIADAARCSFGKEAYKNNDANKRLIFRLMKDGHTSCFEMVEVKFRIKLPIFSMRQHIRHRTAHVNELSARYTELPEEYHTPDLEDIKPQSETNKQGVSDNLYFTDESRQEIRDLILQSNKDAFSDYHILLQKNLAKELARIVTPVSTYTLCIWKIDLHNLFHYLNLRLHSHAQKQIRVYAEAMYSCVKAVCPIACEAFEEYVLYAHSCSRTEWNILTKDMV